MAAAKAAAEAKAAVEAKTAEASDAAEPRAAAAAQRAAREARAAAQKKAAEARVADAQAAAAKEAAKRREEAEAVESPRGSEAAAATRVETAPSVSSADEVALGKQLKDIVRHKAVELGIAMTAEGWVSMVDAVNAINEQRLAAFQPPVTVEQVRAMVARNDKQRFELNEDGARIRAVQGHSIRGIHVGKQLTVETAPQVAVHGSYLEHVDGILLHGLLRMQRNHVHLSKGLLGERGVISGMRRNAEVFVWVNVQAAIYDGINFYESKNGVILCDGRDGDGVLPPTYFSVILELHNLLLRPAHAWHRRVMGDG